MERLKTESFEDYKNRLKHEKAVLKLKKKGTYKTVKKMVDGEEVEIPIVHRGENRRARRDNGGRMFSNKKGIQLVVTRTPNGFMKFRKDIQEIGRKRIVHSVEV